MDSLSVQRALKSIGKSCFIRHIDLFMDLHIADEKVVERLGLLSKWTTSGRKRRVFWARQIIRNGLVKEAVELISCSKLANEDIDHARRWLFKEASHSSS